MHFILLILVHEVIDDHLPQPEPESVASYKFSEERALIHIQKLPSFGIRTVGSFSNEIKSPNMIIDYIQSVNKSLATTHNKEQDILNNVEIDVQKVSGSFALEHFLGGFVNKYENITNILVRISNPNKPETLENAILISAHYDSALACSGTPLYAYTDSFVTFCAFQRNKRRWH